MPHIRGTSCLISCQPRHPCVQSGLVKDGKRKLAAQALAHGEAAKKRKTAYLKDVAKRGLTWTGCVVKNSQGLVMFVYCCCLPLATIIGVLQ